MSRDACPRILCSYHSYSYPYWWVANDRFSMKHFTISKNSEKLCFTIRHNFIQNKNKNMLRSGNRFQITWTVCMQFKWERSTKKRNNNNPNNIHLQNREQKHANKAPKRGTRENWKFSRKFSSKRQMIMGFFCSVCPSLWMWWACSALLPARSGNLCDEIKF